MDSAAYNHIIITSNQKVGGNAIQFSKTCKQVIAIDNNAARLAIAKHNAEIYNCTNIEFILGDFFEICERLKMSGVVADVVFLSPPWVCSNSDIVMQGRTWVSGC